MPYAANGAEGDGGDLWRLSSFKFCDLYEVCDRMTVMRNGRMMMSRIAEVDELDLISEMFGRDLKTVRAHATDFSAASEKAGVEVLAAEGLEIGRMVRGARVEARAGETMGLAGLVGAGRREIAPPSSAPIHRPPERSASWGAN